jgi:hypothetical protein
MWTGHYLGLEFAAREKLFVNHHACDVELLCYRASHQDSFDHGANMAQAHQNGASKLPRFKNQLDTRAGTDPEAIRLRIFNVATKNAKSETQLYREFFCRVKWWLNKKPTSSNKFQ